VHVRPDVAGQSPKAVQLAAAASRLDGKNVDQGLLFSGSSTGVQSHTTRDTPGF
jgi:hypothetical protein